MNMYPPDLRDLSESYELGWQVRRDGTVAPCLNYKKDVPREQYAGKLVIRVKRAEELYKTTTFGKMDPHCKIVFGDFKSQTKNIKDGHQNPEWKEMFDYPIDFKSPSSPTELSVTVFNNKDTVGKVVFNVTELIHVYVKQREKKMAKVLLPVLTESTDGKVVEPPEPPEEGLWFELGRDNHQKTPAGRILLAFKFIDNNPKPRPPRKTVDQGHAAGAPKPPSSPRPTDKKEEKVELGPELTHLTTSRPKVGGKKK